nr:MAG TPA: hypothetical protein [Caudoviricetes sp.]DAH21119.1 MAG TPA: hypothetical protein [Caudoviricetes sp.]DAU23172.1 MAG TPA: hypothetical protein [Caudoviricetes sp.]
MEVNCSGCSNSTRCDKRCGFKYQRHDRNSKEVTR